MKATHFLFAVALLLVAGLALGLSAPSDSARADPAITVGFDMNTTGNTCPGTGSGDCTLGAIDRCASVANVQGTTFDVDLFIQGLNNGFSIWIANIEFPDPINTNAELTLLNSVENNTAFNLIVQSTGSIFVPGDENVPDPPGSTEAGTPFHANGGEFGTFEGTDFTRGVLGRYTFTVGAGATSGVYGLTLDPAVSQYLQGSLNGPGTPYTVDQIWDANSSPQYGVIALGVLCPGAPATPAPVGGIAELPSVFNTPAIPYTALAGAAAAALVLAAAAWWARRRWLR